MTNSKKLNNSSEIGIKHRYIDADKLSASITSAIELSEKIGSDTHSRQRMQYAIALQKVNKIIKEYPAADLSETVHRCRCNSNRSGSINSDLDRRRQDAPG
jgi:hypothetical protein